MQDGILFVAAAGKENDFSENDLATDVPANGSCPTLFRWAVLTEGRRRALFYYRTLTRFILLLPATKFCVPLPITRTACSAGTSIGRLRTSRVFAAMAQGAKTPRDWRASKYHQAGGGHHVRLRGKRFPSTRLEALAHEVHAIRVKSRLWPVPKIRYPEQSAIHSTCQH